jgi:hypothetical protein
MDKHKQKNWLYLIAAFAAGAVLMLAVSVGGGAIYQGYLGGGTNPGTTAPLGPCTLSACSVKSDMVANYALKKDLNEVKSALNALQANAVQQDNFITLLHHVSEVESHLNGLDMSNQSAHDYLATALTDVNSKVEYMQMSLQSFMEYTFFHFTETSNKFIQLGVGGLSQ